MPPELQIADLSRSIEAGLETFAVHYACEGFNDATDHPPGVSTIGVSTVPAEEDFVFSVTDRSIEEREAEIATLEGFFAWLRTKSDARIVHWNMNRSEYGFTALAKRYEYLRGTVASGAPIHSADRLFDLDELIAHRSGRNYARNPRLPTLLALNNIQTRYSLSGAEQAERYRNQAHGELARCTAERVRCIARIAELFVQGTLQTEVSGRSVSFARSKMDSVDVILELAQRMADVAREFKRRHANRVGFELSDEYDYQDMLRGLLRIFFDDVRPEDAVPQVAGAASRVDFILPEVGVAIELKASRPSLDASKIGEELVVDTRRYQAHKDVRRLVCLVFDRDGNVQNPRGLERDLSGMRDGLAVTVKILP
jgi:hypothetical protein